MVGIADHTDGQFVAFCVSGDSVRVSDPNRLDFVARSSQPMTKVRRLLIRITFVIAVFVAYVSSHDAHILGADWPLTLMSGLGGFTAVTLAFTWADRLAGFLGGRWISLESCLGLGPGRRSRPHRSRVRGLPGSEISMIYSPLTPETPPRTHQARFPSLETGPDLVFLCRGGGI
ncbi:hypothetical protein NGF19_13530 [Streptomyces sp. RY43-2]|uniref:Uncharacterized protein n=1 Tax=Streptomyces macrolidinus TaxID=2952607 RepID=A0ABT0ZDY7_9ACTN|nr:hypothetical protein [Streptomyces macrolidinus]MCN9241802.1 hypothetical protein [Streptomyces macrolidinus]